MDPFREWYSAGLGGPSARQHKRKRAHTMAGGHICIVHSTHKCWISDISSICELSLSNHYLPVPCKSLGIFLDTGGLRAPRRQGLENYLRTKASRNFKAKQTKSNASNCERPSRPYSSGVETSLSLSFSPLPCLVEYIYFAPHSKC